MDEIKHSIRQHILATALAGEAPGNLRDHTPLQTSGILDSLAMLGLVSYLEKSFAVELSVLDTGVDQFDTVEQMARVVAGRTAGHAGSSAH